MELALSIAIKKAAKKAALNEKMKFVGWSCLDKRTNTQHNDAEHHQDAD